MINPEYLNNERRFFASFSEAFIGKKTNIIVAESPNLGYSIAVKPDKPATIAVCDEHPKIVKFPENIKTFFRFGIVAHEVLHHIYTDFDTRTRIFRKTKSVLFLLISNIFEDARIEYHAEQVFGGEALKAIELTNEICFLSSKPLNTSMSNYHQLINALIQIKNYGRYTGTVSQTVFSCMNDIADLFAKAEKTCSATECILLAQHATEMIEERLGVYDAKREGAPKHLFNGIGRGKPFRENSVGKRGKVDKFVDSAGGMLSDEESEKPGNNTNENADGAHGSNADDEIGGPGSNADDETGGPGSNADDGTDIPDGNAGDSSDGKGSKEDDSGTVSDKCAASITKNYSSTAGKLNKNIKNFAENTSEEEYPVFSSSRQFRVVVYKAESDDEKGYDFISTSLINGINSLASKLAVETATEPIRKSHATSGKLNIVRASGEVYRGTRIFDRRNGRISHSVAVMIAVDNSGSMEDGEKIFVARSAAIMLAEAFAKAKIPIKIIGYTDSYEHELTAVHTVFIPWNNTRSARLSLMSMSAECANIDGCSIRSCIEELRKRNEKNKVLIVISDGRPNSRSYEGPSAIRDTRDAIKEGEPDIDIFGISLEPENDSAFTYMYGKNGFASIKDVGELPDVLAQKLRKMSEKW